MATQESWTRWEHLPVTEASARGIARLAKDAEAGHGVVITRHGRPVAAVVPLGESAGAPSARPAADPDRRAGADAAATATQRWVQALGGGSRRIPGPPTGT